MKKALITGITGQDGSYLAEFLLKKNYKVHGLIRRSSSSNTSRINHLIKNNNFFLHYGDLSDNYSILNIIKNVKPDEIYNLGAQSHVKVSFDIPEYTADVTAIGTLRILDAIKSCGLKKTKFYQASSSEIFGNTNETPQKESSPFFPCNPYGCAKLYSYWISVNYRESYGLHISNGILFNHESPRRSDAFVSRKITSGLSKIKLGLEDKLYLGNLDARRDWGYAKDFVEGMWLMLQQDKGDDYILATGESHSVRDFVELSCKLLDIDLKWVGSGIQEKGIDKKTKKVIIEVDPVYFRPLEINNLVGDYSKAKKILNWKAKVKFKKLVKLMVESDYEKEKVKTYKKNDKDN